MVDQIGGSRHPAFICASADGGVIVSEAAPPKLHFLSSSLASEKALSGQANSLKRPTGMLLSKSSLFVADSELGLLQRFDLDDGSRHTVPVPELEPIGMRSWSPFGLAMASHCGSSNCLLLVADSRYHRIIVLNYSSDSKPPHEENYTLHAVWGEHGHAIGAFDHPRGLAVHPQTSELYVADRGNDRLQVFSLNGSWSRQIGGSGQCPGRLLGPYAVAFAGGRMIVTECEGRRVQVLTAEGAPLQLLTLGSRSAPTGLAVRDEAVYISDFATGRVHKLRLRSERAAPTPSEAPVEPRNRDEVEDLQASFDRL
jgi:hypothetical protein